MDSKSRVVNFSAGPSVLPLPVLEELQRDLITYKNTGQSVMEMSHRSKEYVDIWNEVDYNLRANLSIPAHFKILNLQGGATLQFAAIPLNLLQGGSQHVDYAVTGVWSEKAAKEAAKYAQVSLASTNKGTNHTTLPPMHEWTLDPQARYLHYCSNETVHGVEFPWTPQTETPLIADMSSNFMSRGIDWDRHAVVYAGAQKNLGPAGNTVVIVDEKLLHGHREMPICPTYCSWKTSIEAQGMYNTPATYSVYAMGVYLKYTKEKGGVAYWEEQAGVKSRLLYDAIAKSDGFYSCPVAEDCRSRMNVPFQIQRGNEPLEKAFLAEAGRAGLINLAGHRSVGGIRASLYNGMPVEGVQQLVDFMAEFQEKAAA